VLEKEINFCRLNRSNPYRRFADTPIDVILLSYDRRRRWSDKTQTPPTAARVNNNVRFSIERECATEAQLMAVKAEGVAGIGLRQT
jgi:hypothetical protein